MKRTRIHTDTEAFPKELREWIRGAEIYDSSSSPEARVYFIDKGDGFYLKSAERGSLVLEAEMTRFFHGKCLAAEVLAHLTVEKDWLLTARVKGEDCTDKMYLDNPTRLCDTWAEILRTLHETDAAGCPVPNRTADYLAAARKNYLAGKYDPTLFLEGERPTAEEAWRTVDMYGSLLDADTLIHGDYCLPNVLLDGWRFRGFIDLGNGGVGDRHVDLFWGAWTLNFNLKTDKYRNRFLDAYGRDKVEEDMLHIIAAAEVFG